MENAKHGSRKQLSNKEANVIRKLCGAPLLSLVIPRQEEIPTALITPIIPPAIRWEAPIGPVRQQPRISTLPLSKTTLRRPYAEISITEKTAHQLADTGTFVDTVQAPIQPKIALLVPQLQDPIQFPFGIGDSPLGFFRHQKPICPYIHSVFHSHSCLFPSLSLIPWLKVTLPP